MDDILIGSGRSNLFAIIRVMPTVRSNRSPRFRSALSLNQYISSLIVGPDFASRVSRFSTGLGSSIWNPYFQRTCRILSVSQILRAISSGSMSFMPRGRVNSVVDNVLCFSFREIIFLRSVQCSMYNRRCLFVCRLRLGLGLCLLCSLLPRVSRAFRVWILLLRRRSRPVGVWLLFQRFRSRSLLQTLGPDSLGLEDPCIPSISSILLTCQLIPL